VSGDYKAATDNLRPELSLYAWAAIVLGRGFGIMGVLRFLPQLHMPHLAVRLSADIVFTTLAGGLLIKRGDS